MVAQTRFNVPMDVRELVVGYSQRPLRDAWIASVHAHRRRTHVRGTAHRSPQRHIDRVLTGGCRSTLSLHSAPQRCDQPSQS
jgi:hypothetical protein